MADVVITDVIVNFKSNFFKAKNITVKSADTLRTPYNAYLDYIAKEFNVTGNLKLATKLEELVDTTKNLDTFVDLNFFFEPDTVTVKLWNHKVKYPVARYDKFVSLCYRIAERLLLPFPLLRENGFVEQEEGEEEGEEKKGIDFGSEMRNIINKTIAFQNPQLIAVFAKRTILALSSFSGREKKFAITDDDSGESRERKKELGARLLLEELETVRDLDIIDFIDEVEKNPVDTEIFWKELYSEYLKPVESRTRFSPKKHSPAPAKMSFIVMEHRQNRGFRNNAFLSNGQSSNAPARIIGFVNSLEEARDLLGPGFPRQESRPFDKVTSSYCLYLDPNVQIRAYTL
jgi:hypothetical protein